MTENDPRKLAAGVRREGMHRGTAPEPGGWRRPEFREPEPTTDADDDQGDNPAALAANIDR